jgi:hypothetical protein
VPFMNLHGWVAFSGIVCVIFGVRHILTRSADWSGDWGHPSFEISGGAAVVQGVAEISLGGVLVIGSTLDRLGLVQFDRVMNAVKAFLEFGRDYM